MLAKCSLVHQKSKNTPPKLEANHNCNPPIFITADNPPMHGGLSAVLNQFGGAISYRVRKYQHGWGALLYKVGKLLCPTASQQSGQTTLPYHEPQPKTQPHHTTTNNKHELPPPYPPAALLSIAMVTSAMAPDLGAASP